MRRQQTAGSPSLQFPSGQASAAEPAAVTAMRAAQRRRPAEVPAAALPSVLLGRTRDGRVLRRVEAAGREFAAFESGLAARVRRSASELCMTNAAEEHRLRVESAMLSEQERRIAREAAARHAGRLTLREDDGGLSLPWEQSLRGAVSHSQQVGNMFSGLYCRITQPEMKEMEIVRTTRQIAQETGSSSSRQQQSQPPLQPADRGRLTLSAAARGGGGGGGGLVEEAARLAQLTRLTMLGRRHGARLRGGRRKQQAGNEGDGEQAEEAGSGLSELIVVGRPLFEQLTPPPLSPSPATAAADSGGAVGSELKAAEGREDDGSLAAASPVLMLSHSLLSFHSRRDGQAVQSLPLLLHNASARTRHFTWTAAAASSSSSPSSCFLLSPHSGCVLPHSSLPLCASFAPPACGSYRQTLKLQLRDEDGEAEGEEAQAGQAATAALGLSVLVLTGSCDEHTRAERAEEGERAKAGVLRELLALPPVAQRPQSSPPPPLAASAERLLFTQRNGAARLHFHRALMPHWRLLWEEVKSRHRPLQRAAMQWSLQAEELRAAIAALPARHQQPHSSAADGLLSRYDALRLQAEERPQPQPARCRLLASLLAAFAAALPPFAVGLRLEQARRRTEQQQAGDGALQAAAAATDGEAELRQELEAESGRVLSAALSHFAAAARPEGSEEAPERGDEAEEAGGLLLLPFRALRTEAESEPPAVDGKAGKSRQPGKAAAARR